MSRIGRPVRLSALLLLCAACGGADREAPDPAASVEADRPYSPECERLDYPCSLADVDPEVMEQSLTLGAAALERALAGSTADAMAWLEGQPGVEEVARNEHALRFRLRGGRAIWVLANHAHGGPAGETDSGVDGASQDEAPPPPAGEASVRPEGTPLGRAARWLLPVAHPALAASASTTQSTSSRLGVVGRDRNGDGKLNNRDPRRALVLSPYKWEFGKWDEGPRIADWLAQTRGYEGAGDVKYLENEQAGVAAFMGWDDYDVIHVSTHGSYVCPKPEDFWQSNEARQMSRQVTWDDCWISVWSGTKVEIVNEAPRDYSAAPEPSATTPPGLENQPMATGTRIRVKGSWPDVPGLEVAVECQKDDLWIPEYEKDEKGKVLTDENGFPIRAVKRDEDGKPVLDEDGNTEELGEWKYDQCVGTAYTAYISLSYDYFAAQYPRGLDKSLVFFSACHSTDDDVGFANTLVARILIGSGGELDARVARESVLPITSLYFGWSKPVRSDYAYRAASLLYDRMLLMGHSARSSNREVVTRGWHVSKKARLLLRPLGAEESEWYTGPDARGTDLRLRELVRLLAPDGGTLEDQREISDMLLGTPDDGEPDSLLLSVSVDGVEERQEAAFKVRFELDAKPIGEAYDLSRARREPAPVTSVYGSSPVAYVIDGLRVETGVDFEAGRGYGLEAIVELPEGGESRYEAIELTVNSSCFWMATVDGEVLKGRQGDIVGYFEGPGITGVNIIQPGTGATLGLIAEEGGEGSLYTTAGGNLGVGPAGYYASEGKGMFPLSLKKLESGVTVGRGSGSVVLVEGLGRAAGTRTIGLEVEFSIGEGENLSGLGLQGLDIGSLMRQHAGPGHDGVMCQVR